MHIIELPFSNDNYLKIDIDGKLIHIKNKFLKKSLAGDTVLVKTKKDSIGYVQKIISRYNNVYSGRIIKKDICYVKTDIPWMPLFTITGDNLNHGDNIEFRFDKWIDKYPSAIYINYSQNITKYLKSRNIPIKFNDDVLRESMCIPVNTHSRKNLTNINSFTLNKKENDSAFSIIEESSSTRLYIHISDMTNIKPGSLIDLEAFNRGYSIDLFDYKVPIIPKNLIDKHYNLTENSIRSCITLDIRFDSDLNILSHDVYFSDIKISKHIPDINSIKKLASVLKKTEYIIKHIYDIDNGLKVYSINSYEYYTDIFLIYYNYYIAKLMFDNGYEFIKTYYKTPKNTDILKNINKTLIDNENILRSIGYEIYTKEKVYNILYDFDIFTSITAPFRCYVDIFNQRILSYMILNKSVNILNIDTIIEHINKRRYISEYERIIYMNSMIYQYYRNVSMDSRVIGITKDGVYVKTEMLFDMFIKTDKKFSIGDDVRAEIKYIDKNKIYGRFEIA